MFAKLEDVMYDSAVPAFFKRATGRDYSDRETCVNDIRRLLMRFVNEREIAAIVAAEGPQPAPNSGMLAKAQIAADKVEG